MYADVATAAAPAAATAVVVAWKWLREDLYIRAHPLISKELKQIAVATLVFTLTTHWDAWIMTQAAGEQERASKFNVGAALKNADPAAMRMLKKAERIDPVYVDWVEPWASVLLFIGVRSFQKFQNVYT